MKKFIASLFTMLYSIQIFASTSLPLYEDLNLEADQNINYKASNKKHNPLSDYISKEDSFYLETEVFLSNVERMSLGLDSILQPTSSETIKSFLASLEHNSIEVTAQNFNLQISTVQYAVEIITPVYESFLRLSKLKYPVSEILTGEQVATVFEAIVDTNYLIMTKSMPTGDCEDRLKICNGKAKAEYNTGIVECIAAGLGVAVVLPWVGLGIGVFCIAVVADEYHLDKKECQLNYQACLKKN